MKFPGKAVPAIDVPQDLAPVPEPQPTLGPQPDKSAAKLKEAQAAKKAAERQAEELRAQLQTATLEIMRLKVEVYDLTHGLT